MANPCPSSREVERKRPERFRSCPELISLSDESSLIARVRELPFREFEFHGYVGKRRTVSFGWLYDFVE